MGLNIHDSNLRPVYRPAFDRPTTAPERRDPLTQLMGLLERAQAGGQAADPNAVRALLGQLDPSTLQDLVKAFLPQLLHPGAQRFFQQAGAPTEPRTPGVKTSGGAPDASSSSSLPDLRGCFPQTMAGTFPGGACTKPSWSGVPSEPGAELDDELCGCDPTPGSDPEKPTSTASGKTFDVWFEHKDGQKTKQRSPIVLDLNGNGRPDLTGDAKVENGRWVAKGEGKVDFDLDPSKRSWKTKSVERRPGHGAPGVPGGTAKIYDAAGKLVSEGVPLKDALKRGKNGIQEGRVEVYDAKGELVGELKKDEQKGKMMYHWGNRQDAERTEWMAPGGEDGLLAWDVNGDGKIDSSKELFGEFDVDGTKKFANGYEKLAAYFDANRDGTVDASELATAHAKGVRVWRDVNGDAKTDAGELGTLEQHGIRSLGVQVDAADMSSSFERT